MPNLTKIIPAAQMLDFFCDNGGEVSFDAAYFARHSEHVSLQTELDGRVSYLNAQQRGDRLRLVDAGWLDDVIGQIEPFAHPSRT